MPGCPRDSTLDPYHLSTLIPQLTPGPLPSLTQRTHHPQLWKFPDSSPFSVTTPLLYSCAASPTTPLARIQVPITHIQGHCPFSPPASGLFLYSPGGRTRGPTFPFFPASHLPALALVPDSGNPPRLTQLGSCSASFCSPSCPHSRPLCPASDRPTPQRLSPSSPH